MIDFKEIEGHLIALVVWNLDKEDDVHVYVGHLLSDGTDYLFKNEDKGWRVSISADKLEDLELVTPELKETFLNADYGLNLTVADMVDNDGQYVPTGMKWHS